jgi:quinoprotein glucose dehydrogenase
LGAAFAAALGGSGVAQNATGWSSSNYNESANRYSPLDQINAANVATLQPAWRFHLKPAGYTGPLKTDEAIPVVIGNMMYIASPYGAIHALDATTGAEKWKFQLPNNDVPSKRGLAYWPGGNGAQPQIVFGGASGGMYSVNASNGALNDAFGDNGVVHLKTPEVMQTGMEQAYSLLSSPSIYKDLIITGAGTGEGPGGSNGGLGPAGDTRAWDARTGRLVWTFHTVPRPGEFGYDTWGGDSAKNRSGVNIWGYTSLDAERGILYMPLGAPNNDRVGTDRPGNNLFSSSVVAVDANTGKYLWHFQLVHHDIWDYDMPAAPILIDINVDGRPIKAVVQTGKQAFAYVFDRTNGQPVWPIPETPVKQTDVPGEWTSPTQPIPSKPPAFGQQSLKESDLIDFTPALRQEAVAALKASNLRYGDIFMPGSLANAPDGTRGTVMFFGGTNWWGGRADPETGFVYISSSPSAYVIALRPNTPAPNAAPANPALPPFDYVTGGGAAFPTLQGLSILKPPYGRITAYDMNKGTIAWQIANGDTPANVKSNPKLQGLNIPKTGSPRLVGLMVTKTLLFAGDGTTPLLHAYDKKTGEDIAQIQMPGMQTGVPMTYVHQGRQFILVPVAANAATGTIAQLVAYALPLPAATGAGGRGGRGGGVAAPAGGGSQQGQQ